MSKIMKSLVTEYGLKWAFHRGLYSAKLKMMRALPMTEKLFEKNISVKRIDIFDFDVVAIKKILMKLEVEKKEGLILMADKAIEGVITGFSSTELDYGKPVNWHFNPLTKTESRKDLKWYQIPDFSSTVGDIKVIWEVSRFTHFLYFARAYILTEDIKYYKAFASQLDDWLKNNLYSYGVNYKCGQEATLRMVNALMVYSIFRDVGVDTERERSNVIKLVEGSYKKILSNFFYANKCIKNNHTFSELLGQIVGAWCCEDEREVAKSYQLIDREIRNQFFTDGGYIQYSFNYQRFTLQILECLYKVSEKTGLHITETERIKNSVLMMFQLQVESGDLPNYGSNDGALIFPVTTCGYRDFRPVLNTIYALVEGKKLYETGDYDEELLWFGNKRTLKQINIERKPSIYHFSGLYTLRHKEGFLMICLQNFKTRPAHMDQLHIDLWHKGINIFCDSGTFSYASDIGKVLSSTVAHNTAKVFDLEQMNKKSAFFITNWTKRIDATCNSEHFIGKMISKNGYEHTRSIKKSKYGYLIDDNVSGNGKYCEFNFHTPCEVNIKEDSFELFEKGKLICTVNTSGTIEVSKVYRSLYYLKKEEINCVSIKRDMEDRKCNMVFDIQLINC